MITIRELINKIVWSKEENPDDYEIFYYDRIEKKLISFKVKDIIELDGLFILLPRINPDEDDRSIPFHRVKVVRKKGEIIWERKY